ncbi:MAG: ABC transporter substrate-binding protein, partial [Candidatus Dormibacteraceae bacterium]
TVVALNQLVDDGAVAFEGPPQSTAELAIQSLVDQRKIPDVSVGAADQQTIPVHPYMWQTTPLSSQVANTMIRYLKSQGKTKIATLTDTKNAYAVAGEAAFHKLATQDGLQVVDAETFELGQTDFSPQFAKIVASHPDFFVVWSTGAPPVVITKQWAAESTAIPLMMSAAEASPLYIQPSGPAAEGVYIQATLGVVGQDVPACNRYKKMIDAFATPYQKANKLYPPQFAWDSMVAMSLIFDAIRRKGATSSDIKSGLDSVNLDTPQGHYVFTKTRHYGLPNSSNLMTQVKNGQMAPVGLTQKEFCSAGQGPATQFA